MSRPSHMRALITGISGFVGGHLASHLLASGADVYGIDRKPLNDSAHSSAGRYRVFIGDLLDDSSLRVLVKEIDPTHVFHLAGVLGGAPGGSTIQYQVNVVGTVRLLDTLQALGLDPWILIASSSAVYGPALNLPIAEEQSFRPVTHYAASKAAQELVAIQYHLAYGMQIVRTRTFNLVGPGQSRSMLPSDLAHQVALAELGGPPVLRVGNLTPRRDYTDVRDAVRAYTLLATSSRPGEVYNVCSGHSCSVQECVDLLMALSRVPLKLEVERSRMRAVEISDQVGSSERLWKTTGWRPELPLEKSLGDLLDDWRNKLSKTEEA